MLVHNFTWPRSCSNIPRLFRSLKVESGARLGLSCEIHELHDIHQPLVRPLANHNHCSISVKVCLLSVCKGRWWILWLFLYVYMYLIFMHCFFSSRKISEHLCTRSNHFSGAYCIWIQCSPARSSIYLPCSIVTSSCPAGCCFPNTRKYFFLSMSFAKLLQTMFHMQSACT